MVIRNEERGGEDAMTMLRGWVKKIENDFCKEKGRKREKRGMSL